MGSHEVGVGQQRLQCSPALLKPMRSGILAPHVSPCVTGKVEKVSMDTS